MFGAGSELCGNEQVDVLQNNSFKKQKKNTMPPVSSPNQLQVDETQSGLIPRFITELFNGIANHSQSKFNVFCSFMQIYNEKIFDLLSDSRTLQPLNIHESKIDGLFVEGLVEY